MMNCFQDYNSAQRQSFCVYSGKGISQLRTYLTELFDRITEQNGTDDTEYDEEEDDDTVAFQENESPEPEAADVDDDVLLEQVHARQQGTRSAPRARRDGPSRYEVPQHALGPENQRLRMLTIPTFFGPNHQRISATNRAQAESTVQGATSVLQQQLQQASTSRRDRGPGAGQRAFADMLPILESPTSPHDPRQLSSPFNPDNHRVFHPPPPQGALPGARTPDLNFAEIGRGRGVQPYTVEPSRAPRRRHPVFETEPSHIPANPRASNLRAMSDPGIHPATHHAMTYARPNGIRQDLFDERVQADEGLRMVRTQRRRDNVRSPNGGDGSRPRSQLRSRIRNGLHTAENYASSFFSRTGMPPPPDVQDPDVNSQHPQQPPSGRA
jgi:F-box and leucine-rich repeat protein GRR1